MGRAWAMGLLAAGACLDFDSLQHGTPSDGGPMDAPIEAPPEGFVVTIDPQHLDMDPMDSASVNVTITRGQGFMQAVNVKVIDGPNQIAFSSPTFAPSQSTLPLMVTMNMMPPLVDTNVIVQGISADGLKSSSAKLGIHAGSLLVVASGNMSVQVPAFADALVIKAWGAGGGGNEGVNAVGDIYSGGTGGGGGYAAATISVTPNEMLDIVVGKGGPVGGGGGYSGVLRGTTPLVIAGAGGGGSRAYELAQSGNCAQGGANGNGGAAGGGMTGDAPGNAAGPGTQTMGGAAGNQAAAGAMLAGGNGGKVSNSKGGAPGGGGDGKAFVCGEGEGGGGGAGWFGGGGGGYKLGGPGTGGGGGSGYAVGGSLGVNLITGKGPAAGNATDADRGGAGDGGGSGVWVNCNPNCTYQNATPGANGRVVVRLVKP